jgi:transcriptional regulator with XRE-family HTH domain
MAGTVGNGVAGHFARQMKKERLAHGWSIAELARRMEVMAVEMRHLLAVAAMPLVTLTVMPAIAHAANASGFVLADDAAWCEHLAAGGLFTDPQIVSALAARFDSLRAESYRASESAAMIAKAGELWTAGVNPATQMATGGSA